MMSRKNMKDAIKNRSDWFMAALLVRYECPNQARGGVPKDKAKALVHTKAQLIKNVKEEMDANLAFVQ